MLGQGELQTIRQPSSCRATLAEDQSARSKIIQLTCLSMQYARRWPTCGESFKTEVGLGHRWMRDAAARPARQLSSAGASRRSSTEALRRCDVDAASAATATSQSERHQSSDGQSAHDANPPAVDVGNGHRYCFNTTAVSL